MNNKKMNRILVFCLCLCPFFQLSFGQFNMASLESECGSGRVTLDPLLVQALKSKMPKKFSSKLDYGKDFGLSKLATAKVLAKHMKNLNNLNYDFQNLMYQQQQPSLMQMNVDQNSLFAQQQQQQLQNLYGDTSRSVVLPQIDASQLQAAISQLTDQRYQQQPSYHLTAQSKHYTRPQSQCSCEDCDFERGSRIRHGLRLRPRTTSRLNLRPQPQDPLSSIFSACLGVLNSFFK